MAKGPAVTPPQACGPLGTPNCLLALHSWDGQGPEAGMSQVLTGSIGTGELGEESTAQGKCPRCQGPEETGKRVDSPSASSPPQLAQCSHTAASPPLSPKPWPLTRLCGPQGCYQEVARDQPGSPV